MTKKKQLKNPNQPKQKPKNGCCEYEMAMDKAAVILFPQLSYIGMFLILSYPIQDTVLSSM